MKQFYLEILKREMRSKGLLIMMVLSFFFCFFIGNFIDLLMVLLKEKTGDMMEFTQYKWSVFAAIINGWTVLIGLHIGARSLKEDQVQGILNSLLAMPISRFKYLCSRFLAGSTLIYFQYIICLSIAWGILIFSSEPIEIAYAQLGKLLIFNLFFSMGVMLTGMFISLFIPSSSAFFVHLFSFFMIVYSNGFYSKGFISSFVTSEGAFKYIAAMIHMVTPPLGRILDLVAMTLLDRPLDGEVLYIMGHFIIGMLLTAFFLNRSFSKKSF